MELALGKKRPGLEGKNNGRPQGTTRMCGVLASDLLLLVEEFHGANPFCDEQHGGRRSWWRSVVLRLEGDDRHDRARESHSSSPDRFRELLSNPIVQAPRPLTMEDPCINSWNHELVTSTFCRPDHSRYSSFVPKALFGAVFCAYCDGYWVFNIGAKFRTTTPKVALYGFSGNGLTFGACAIGVSDSGVNEILVLATRDEKACAHA
ncbi:hypothetical protein KSP40_PGU017879 [Platanthera guangdongensis]|uniref:Uncharacterized protein n=1 Tax=Platanthera guangdongensis TaxID=2320717 RepID=A0ABR2MKE5_9ASPA